MSRKKSSGPRVRPEQLLELAALALLATSVFGFLATASFAYSPFGAGNLCGAFGYQLAFESVFWLGWAAYIVYALGAIWGGILFLRRQALRPFLPKLFGLVILALGAAIFFEHQWPLEAVGGSTHASAHMPTGAGGVIGYVCTPFLHDGFGSPGTYLILGLLIAIALMLATDFAFYSTIRAAVEYFGSGRQRRGARREEGEWLGGLRRLAATLAAGLRGKPALVAGAESAESEESGAFEEGAAPRPPLGQRLRTWASRTLEFLRAEPPIYVREGGAGTAVAEEDANPKAVEDWGASTDEEAESEAEIEAFEDESGYEFEYEGEDELEGALEDGDEYEDEDGSGEEGECEWTEEAGADAGSQLSPMTAVETDPSERDPEDGVSKPAARRGKGRGAKGLELPFPEPEYSLPPVELLETPGRTDEAQAAKEIRASGRILERALESFRIDASVVGAQRGPVVTMYELELSAGTKVSRITALSDDLAIALKAPSVRVVAPIPGKSTVGIEAPNSIRELVRLDELIIDEIYEPGRYAIPLLLGKDVGGKMLIDDLAKMPHLLIAGATGSGKSVCINSIISSILLTRSPKDVKLILIDPKMVELQAYQRVPHLICPVVTNMRKAPGVLDWAVQEMESRYELLSQTRVRNIASFNRLGPKKIRQRLEEAFGEDSPTHIPYIVLIVDELADLMMQAAKEIETSITRLAQKSRAVGIHVILATQRPSTNVITGLIKANMPTRIAFQVASKIDSRVILDYNGAETLLGGGDMLYAPPGTSALWRAQGTFVADAEIRQVVDHVAQAGAPRFIPELLDHRRNQDQGDGADADELYEKALRIILKSQRGSASLLQRALGIGYTRASRLIDLMAGDGLVGEYKGSQAREVMMTLEEWDATHGSEGGE